ncbi:uncharacterized protein LOC113315337 [Papaver somniferum]|uniref:uncharacterized protein LOC113315337 n=1 Tax=Papaver somniferum TaxID=3469 RepID=UPI000E703450|nr:uncharacterized protein LOC113315337 [Papaver somniferum]
MNISIWNYIWIKDKALAELHPENEFLKLFLDMKVSDILLEGDWVIPIEILEMFDITELPVADNKEDRRTWSANLNGEFTVASAVESIKKKQPKLQWTKKVWNHSIHPSISSNVWKLKRNICSTDDNMKKRNFNISSRCPFCRNSEENMDHILWNCNHSEIVWKWLGDMFYFKNPRSFEEIFNLANQKSPSVKEIWFLRNKCVYENEIFNGQKLKTRILKLTTENEVRMKARFGIQHMIYRGNPGNSEYVFVGKNSWGECIVEIAGGLGVATNYYAEVMALLCVGEWAVKNGKLNVIFRIDSKAVITTFTTGQVTWFAITRWSKIIAYLQ